MQPNNDRLIKLTRGVCRGLPCCAASPEKLFSFLEKTTIWQPAWLQCHLSGHVTTCLAAMKIVIVGILVYTMVISIPYAIAYVVCIIIPCGMLFQLCGMPFYLVTCILEILLLFAGTPLDNPWVNPVY